MSIEPDVLCDKTTREMADIANQLKYRCFNSNWWKINEICIVFTAYQIATKQRRISLEHHPPLYNCVYMWGKKGKTGKATYTW